MRILVTICTRNRPKMLEACLRSVTAQTVPEGICLRYRDYRERCALTCQPIADRVAAETGWKIHTVLEPELGCLSPQSLRHLCGRARL